MGNDRYQPSRVSIFSPWRNQLLLVGETLTDFLVLTPLENEKWPFSSWCSRTYKQPTHKIRLSLLHLIRMLSFQRFPSKRGFQTWASEGFFPGGGQLRIFPKFFSKGGAKSGEVWFCPSKLKKQPFFANNFKIQGWPWSPCPPFRRPCFQIVGPKIRIVTWNRYFI